LYNIAHFCTEELPFVHRWRNIVAKLPPKTYVPLKNCWIWRFVWKNTLQGKKARRQGETPCTYWFGSPFGVHITDSKWWGDVHRNLVHQLTRRLLARPFDQSIDRSDILNTLDLVRAWSLVNSRGLVGDRIAIGRSIDHHKLTDKLQSVATCQMIASGWLWLWTLERTVKKATLQ
jgi:hypothetical protein